MKRPAVLVALAVGAAVLYAATRPARRDGTPADPDYPFSVLGIAPPGMTDSPSGSLSVLPPDRW